MSDAGCTGLCCPEHRFLDRFDGGYTRDETPWGFEPRFGGNSSHPTSDGLVGTKLLAPGVKRPSFVVGPAIEV